MAQGRTGSARPTRGRRAGGPGAGSGEARSGGQSRDRARGRSGGGGIPWMWLAVLVLIGGAVLAAREVKLPHLEANPTALPTAVAEAARAPTRAPQVAQAATPKSTAEPRPTAESTLRSTAGPVAATPAAGVAATPAAAARPRATATRPPATATPGATVAATTNATASAPANASAPAGASAGGAAAEATTAVGSAGVVMLTFDAGADRGYAEDILDELANQHVVASFGITGAWAKANPELVKRMAADGHQVFNHTLDHRSFTGVSDQRGGLTAAQRRQELENADAIIAPLLGHSTQPWYRLPYGDDDAHVAADVQPAGYTHKIGWTVDSLGWRGASSTDIVSRCLKLAASGALYALHVGRASQDAIALPQVIRGLRDRGFAFRRVDQT